jgi:hypothetical protein
METKVVSPVYLITYPKEAELPLSNGLPLDR